MDFAKILAMNYILAGQLEALANIEFKKKLARVRAAREEAAEKRRLENLIRKEESK